MAYRSGSLPECTPAFAAVELYLSRTFGRWQIQPLDNDSSLEAGRSSVLVEALAARLTLRKVQAHLGCSVVGVTIRNGRVVAVTSSDGYRKAAAVIASCDPWQTFNTLLPTTAARPTRRGLRQLGPAAAPTITHQETPAPAAPVMENVALNEAGVPTVSYRRQIAGGGVHSVHDFNQTHPQPSYGVAWNGFSSWLHRPLVTTEIPGLYTAGPFSPAGPAPSHVVLSAALAAYACHDYLRVTA